MDQQTSQGSLLRISQIVGVSPERAKAGKRTRTPIKPMVPVSRSTWWSWVKSGKAPQPIKIGEKTTCWRLDDILKWIESEKEKHDEYLRK